MKLQRMEKRAYLAYQGDGLVDLALGLVVLLFGLGMQYDVTLLAPICATLGYPSWLLAKKRITERRLGYVEFGKKRKRRERRGMVYLLLLGILTLIVAVSIYLSITRGGSGPSGFRQHGYLLLGVIFGVMTSRVWLLVDVIRLHAYSLLILLMVSMGHFLNWPEPYGVLIPGIVMAGSGTVLLILFIRRYPVRDGEENLISKGGG